jgi:hypothetical protein
MKTQTIRKIQNNHFNSNTKNQKVMKTKKYSNSMKALAALAMMFLISGVAFSQTIEERKGASSNYSVVAGAATDEYTWTIAAATAPTSVVPAPTSGSGTIADPYVIDWIANQTSIAVTWDADASPDIASTAGVVTVQKRTTVGSTCTSAVETVDIDFWSIPDAAINALESDQDVCSADAITGSITIDLTGARDLAQSGNDGFEVTYDVAVSHADLTVSGANGPVGAGQTVNSDGATVTIPLPDALVNINAAAQTYTITLTFVEDDFDDGPHAVAGEVYTITVNPIPTTGIISSTGTLTRR